MFFVLWGLAFADQITDEFTRAQEALAAEDYTTLNTTLKKIRKLAGKSNRLLTPEEISNIWFLEGLGYLKQNDFTSSIDPLRQSIILNPRRDFDNDFVSAEDNEDFFFAIQSEMLFKDKINPCIPQQFGTAKIYIDGKERVSDDNVLEGTHLAQVMCPKGDVYSTWTNFKKPLSWVKMCPYRFDLRVPCPDPSTLGPFDELPLHCQEPPPTGQALTHDPSCPPPPIHNISEIPTDIQLSKPLLIAGSVSLLAAGTIYYFALQGRALFNNLDPTKGTVITSRDELYAIQESVNTKVYLSAGLGIAGIGLSGAAFIYKGTF